MSQHHTRLSQVFFWGAITGALYFGLFYYSELILGLAHRTPAHCLVGQGAESLLYHKIDPAICAEKGGIYEAARWYYVLVPITIAFAISYAHGTFTGAFWDYMGLKPANNINNNKVKK